MSKRSIKIAAVPGDGIGPEVIDAGMEVLQAVAERDGGFEINSERFDWGSERYLSEGYFMPENGL